MDADKPTQRPLLISHRGAHKEAPENSCQAFERALEYGVDGIETDVQLSRDGVPVLFHNPTAYHVTGSRKRISTYTWEQLSAIELGGAGAGIGIPTLDETLTMCAYRSRLFIEIKSRKPDRRVGRHLRLAEKVVGRIARLPSGARRAIRILSFDPDVLRQVNTLAPQLKCVLNTDGSGSWGVPAADLLSGRFVLEFLNAVCLEQKKLSARVVNWAHRRKMGVLTYCCNTRAQVVRALALGVDGIMSDKPGWLVSTFNRLRSEG